MIMKLRRCTVFYLLLCILSATAIVGQGQRKQPTPKVDKELEQRRATAMSMLQSLAIEARSYRDEPLRARFQARIADVIWTQDRPCAVFEQLAQENFFQALDAAKAFTGDSP